MEVVGQWRREWAGTAEYGKVTENGVTRNIARAMEVLQSSGPGSRMRVMRAAYHSTAGSGAPASSFLMHSSRRVISSGSKLLESPTFMKPFEIASIPLELESSPERCLDTGYKVTEPDDFEISEPSKWRNSAKGIPKTLSEESSSVDNASIIDLSQKTNVGRTLSMDSENSDILSHNSDKYKKSSLNNPLDTLHTLKYKSLLNGHSTCLDDRRNSYSFETTSPVKEIKIFKEDKNAMESSTDSGIHKSTDIMNFEDHHSFMEPLQTQNFQDWLARNRPPSFRRPVRPQSLSKRIEENKQNNISLQSTRKVSISINMDNEADKLYNDDLDKKSKKVDFSKTELHFTAESGTVNIIATDDKPPPSNDFRKKRSAFVPLNGRFVEKPMTLFGRTQETYEEKESTELEICMNQKSILKNKIPKPKPYHLGANSFLGPQINESHLSNKKEFNIPISYKEENKQNEYTKKIDMRLKSELSHDTISNISTNEINNKGKQRDSQIELPKTAETTIPSQLSQENHKNHFEKHVTEKLIQIQRQNTIQPKMRPLKGNELKYFGINDDKIDNRKPSNNMELPKTIEESDDYFKSVKLIQQVSSGCNSETDSFYQNYPTKSSFKPVPTPRHTNTTNSNINPHKAPVNYRTSYDSGRKTYTRKGLSQTGSKTDFVNNLRSDENIYEECDVQENDSKLRTYVNTNDLTSERDKNVPIPKKRTQRYVDSNNIELSLRSDRAKVNGDNNLRKVKRKDEISPSRITGDRDKIKDNKAKTYESQIIVSQNSKKDNGLIQNKIHNGTVSTFEKTTNTKKNNEQQYVKSKKYETITNNSKWKYHSNSPDANEGKKIKASSHKLTDKSNNKTSHTYPKKTEHVINYNAHNGNTSSTNKSNNEIKSGYSKKQNESDRKKSITSDKKNLLDNQEYPASSIGLHSKQTKRRKSTYAPRTCEIL